MKLLQIGCLLAILAATGSAQAQWIWINADGRKVYSDRPPPVEISDKLILKRPAAAPVSQSAKDAEAAAGAGTPVPTPKPSEDKALLARKKQLADAEAAKTSAEQERIDKIKAENCSRARQGKATYDSGLRISTVTSKGEREYLTEEAIAREQRHLAEVINSECK